MSKKIIITVKAPKVRNHIAASLADASFRPRVVKSKKAYSRKPRNNKSDY